MKQKNQEKEITWFKLDPYYVKFPIKVHGKIEFVEVPRTIVPFKEVHDKDCPIESIGFDEANSMIGVQAIYEITYENITFKANRLFWITPASKETFDEFVKSKNKTKYFEKLRKTLLSVNEDCESYKFYA